MSAKAGRWELVKDWYKLLAWFIGCSHIIDETLIGGAIVI